MLEVKAPPIYRVVLHRHFDIDDAKMHEKYFLEESKMVGIFRKRRKWVPVIVRRGYDGNEWTVRASGDENWAKHIMKEFNIRGVVLK